LAYWRPLGVKKLLQVILGNSMYDSTTTIENSSALQKGRESKYSSIGLLFENL
jgi:hypothetical protein